MPVIVDPLTATVIPSQWGKDVGDRIVQIFATEAALGSGTAGVGGTYQPLRSTGPYQIGGQSWVPVPGSLAFVADPSPPRLWRCKAIETGSVAVWEMVSARGLVGAKTNVITTDDKTLKSGVWSDIIVINKTTPGAGGLQYLGIRRTRTYLFCWEVNPYQANNQLSLFDTQAYVRKAGTTAALSGITRKCGQGWVGGLFSSFMHSGVSAMVIPQDVDDVEFVWRGQAYTGKPDVTASQAALQIVEVGG